MKKNTTPNLNKGESWKDLVEMQTEFALLDSMLKSKTLVIMVIVLLTLLGGFCYFLYRMAT
ncbi:MAG: hypothetical protein ACPG46_11330 [Thalassotalea sp.]